MKMSTQQSYDVLYKIITGGTDDLMVECVNAHDRCYGGAGGPCPWCEPTFPLRSKDGKFASPTKRS